MWDYYPIFAHGNLHCCDLTSPPESMPGTPAGPSNAVEADGCPIAIGTTQLTGALWRQEHALLAP